ncbi:MAG: nucleotidyltransferase [Leptolyngbya sp. ERB_1_1]
MTHPDLQNILSELRQYLQQEYGDRLTHIVLYGSQARNSATDQSDIDVLAVLDDSFDFVQEVKRTNDFISDLCLDCAVVVSLMFARRERFDQENSPFFLNVRREGVLV